MRRNIESQTSLIDGGQDRIVGHLNRLEILVPKISRLRISNRRLGCDANVVAHTHFQHDFLNLSRLLLVGMQPDDQRIGVILLVVHRNKQREFVNRRRRTEFVFERGLG